MTPRSDCSRSLHGPVVEQAREFRDLAGVARGHDNLATDHVARRHAIRCCLLSH
jgi:hypothetical protein